jgi:hypothetical protein
MRRETDPSDLGNLSDQFSDVLNRVQDQFGVELSPNTSAVRASGIMLPASRREISLEEFGPQQSRQLYLEVPHESGNLIALSLRPDTGQSMSYPISEGNERPNNVAHIVGRGSSDPTSEHIQNWSSLDSPSDFQRERNQKFWIPEGMKNAPHMRGSLATKDYNHYRYTFDPESRSIVQRGF